LALIGLLLALVFFAGCAPAPVPPEPVGDVPPQPGEDRWRFIDDLKAPMWTRHPWGTTRPAGAHADLSRGVRLRTDFPDPHGRLEAAYEDLRRFLAAGRVRSDDGPYVIETASAPDLEPEAFKVEVGDAATRILGADVEGIRRGLFHLEDEMLRRRGPDLPLGAIERRPFIRRRISRCFFGPIKRPPKLRDELMDDEDYYPEQYLNRLAHEGINGLWLTVEFRDLVATSFTPESGRDAERRLAKLRRTVDACLRYGIRTYLFSIEPRAWDADSPAPKRHPELAGASLGGGRRAFCPCSDAARRYLAESVGAIFRRVPELGGLINISHGERQTTCLSALSAFGEGRIDCPRCSGKAPWEILHASLSAMERAMHEVAPEAELLSWLYMPQARGRRREDLADWVYEIPAHTPPGVILQFNFESGVRGTQFGKQLVGGDYWISNPGPSPRFDRIATTAKTGATPVSAKIQTACSHEVATVPEVPVPSLLHRKFSEMKRLGVGYAMLCWYFGNYPGIMNKAAGELAFEPFPRDEDEFLTRLAAIDWGETHAPSVVRAWKHFREGYERFPLTVLFQYYGPMHDGPVWPLHLKPRDEPLAPTWLLASPLTRAPWPPSGDRIGECLLDALTLQEAVEGTRLLSESWDRGIEVLAALEPVFRNEPERMRDIGVARALGLQFRSGHHILRFYFLRENLLRREGSGRRKLLIELSTLLRQELDIDEQLLALCEQDSRLGFHSEAEGYKYYPEKIRWRMRQIRNVLATDLPELEGLIREGRPLFPEYTGRSPQGATATAVADGVEPRWQTLGTTSALRWGATYDDQAIHVFVTGAEAPPPSELLVKVEPRRLWPCKQFLFIPEGETLAELPDTVAPQSVEGRITNSAEGWRAAVRIPRERIGLPTGRLEPIRLDVQVVRKGRRESWVPSHPLTYRLNLGSDNPADLGWMIYEPPGDR
jgi:hypothetical protein